MRTRLRPAIAMLPVAAVAAFVLMKHGGQPPAMRVAHLAVTLGPIVQTAAATGTISPTRTVDIGTEVSGVVEHLYVDYNSIVRAHQVLARLDPAQSEAALRSARASVDRAAIDLQTHEDALAEDERNLQRSSNLYQHETIAQADEEAAQLLVDEDEAQIRQDQAAVDVARAGVRLAQTNLDHCTIASPIDGVVIARNVDEGQAVAAAVSAPTLYVLGTNLDHVVVVGEVAEADVSKVRVGQQASFTVDAYPSRTFHGTVSGVRLTSTTVNNVVSYETVVDVDNPDLALRPGMTAAVSIEIARAGDVRRVPNAALRFRPAAATLAAIHVPVPVATAPSAAAPVVVAATAGGADTIDSRFASVATTLTTGLVWIWDHDRLSPVVVRLGITDGTWTQVIDGALSPGDQVVTGIVVSAPGRSTR